jgi:hypothetical protein
MPSDGLVPSSPRSANDRRNDPADPCGRPVWLRLSRVKPSDDRLDHRECHDLSCPSGQRRIRNLLRQLVECDADRGPLKLLHLSLKLRLACGVAEQKSETVGVLGGRREEAIDARGRIPWSPRRKSEPASGLNENGPIQVRLRVEVAVQDGPGDAGFASDVIEARRREARPGEGPSSRHQDLLAPRNPPQPLALAGPGGWRIAFGTLDMPCHAG